MSTKPPAGTWVVERLTDGKFPYRVTIMDDKGRTTLVLRAQDRWPAANRNIFCLRETGSEASGSAPLEIERVPVIAVQRRGVRMSVVLDRPRYKRCDFLFLVKTYKSRPSEQYEQIYWQTQTSMAQRRPSVAPVALRSGTSFTVRIASDERYPWSFPGCQTEKRKLPSGDYALMFGEQIKAVVERKTLENLLADFGVMPLLHQRMLELATYEHNALVVEAPYEDFLNRAKIHHYSPSFCAAAIADLYASHPRLKIVFCSNRKTANLWTQSFFAAVNHLAETPVRASPEN
jgi:hypothetical protein